MSIPYQVMYRIGFTPWEHHGAPEPLIDLLDALPPGDMLDIGCGTGRDAALCAARGWRVTGIDTVSVALKRAQRNAQQAGVSVRFRNADVRSASRTELGSGFTLLQDVGCIAGLSDVDRRRAVATVTNVAAPGAVLLLFSFGEGGGGRVGPRRLELPEIRTLFSAWDVASSRPADELDVRGPMRDAPRSWHQLVKR